MPKEILVHLAYCMEVAKLEQDEVIFRYDDNYDKFIIVLDGLLELYTDMDKATDFRIEYLASGSVINAH